MVAGAEKLLPPSADEATLRAALDAAGGRVKPAVLIAHGMTADSALTLLARSGGRLRTALEETSR